MELTKVQKGSTTKLARLSGLFVLAIGMLAQMGVVTQNSAQEIVGGIGRSQGSTLLLVCALIGALTQLIQAVLPAVQGWMTKERELPQGATLERDADGNAQVVVNTANARTTTKVPLIGLVAVCALPLLLAGCSLVPDGVGNRIGWSPLRPLAYEYRGDSYIHGAEAQVNAGGTEVIGMSGYVETRDGTLPVINTYVRSVSDTKAEFGAYWSKAPMNPPVVMVPPPPVKVLAVEK